MITENEFVYMKRIVTTAPVTVGSYIVDGYPVFFGVTDKKDEFMLSVYKDNMNMAQADIIFSKLEQRFMPFITGEDYGDVSHQYQSGAETRRSDK